MSDAPFLTLAGRGAAEIRIRGSTFLAVADSADTEDAARELLAECQRDHFSAAHHCSAWRLRSGTWRANDAGEPSGSAGAPILAAIDGAGLTDCVVIVTRYFGGTKLGVGGLIRAYGDAAAQALHAAPRRSGTPARRLRIRYPYGHTSVVMRVLELGGARKVEHGYTAEQPIGEVEFSVTTAAEPEVAELLRELSAGTLSAEPLGNEVLFQNV